MNNILSIITINRNNSLGLNKTIQSVINQSIKDFEYIIIDGDSTDGSKEIIILHENKIDHWISETDEGIYNALNKGIMNANGKYLIFLNSGDHFTDKNVLEKIHQSIKQLPDIDIFYGDIYGFKNSSDNRWLHQHPENLELPFLKRNNINHQSSIFKRDIFNELGMYPEQYKLAADHWIYLKSFLCGKQFKHIASPIVMYNYDGLSAVKYSKYVEEMDSMWNELVPPHVNTIISKLEKYEHERNYKIVSFSIKINNLLQLMRRILMKNFEKHRL